MDFNPAITGCVFGRELQPLLEFNPNAIRTANIYDIYFSVACYNENLPGITLIIDKATFEKVPLNFYKEQFFAACKKGNIEVAKLLFARKGGNDTMKKLQTSKPHYSFSIILHHAAEAFLHSCVGNQVEIAQWLVKEADIDIHEKDDVISILTRKFGWSEWNWSFKICIFLKDQLIQAYEQMCLNECWSILNWLSTLSKKHHLFPDLGHRALALFTDLCLGGKVQMAKYLVQAHKQKGYHMFDVHYRYEKTYYLDSDTLFRRVCVKGHLEIAGLLIELRLKKGLGMFDIHLQNERLFRALCNQGCLETVMWLDQLIEKYDLGAINFKTLNHNAFIDSYGTQNFEISEYIMGKCMIPSKLANKYKRKKFNCSK